MIVLAVTCHPDDAELCAGGTFLKYAKRGDRVFICHVANGNKGDCKIDPDKLREIRRQEAINGGRILKAEKVYSLDVDDLCVDSHDEAQVQALIRVICETRPDVIITHPPEDYMKDHSEVSNLVFDASFSATVPHKAGDHYLENVPPIYYMDSSAGIGFQPEYYVDITEEYDEKIRAIECHASQLQWLSDHDHCDVLETTWIMSRFRGYQCNVKYAECFRACKRHLHLTSRMLLPL